MSDALVMTNVTFYPLCGAHQCSVRPGSRVEVNTKLRLAHLTMENVSTHELNIQLGSPTHSHAVMRRKCCQTSVCDFNHAPMQSCTRHGHPSAATSAPA